MIGSWIRRTDLDYNSHLMLRRYSNLWKGFFLRNTSRTKRTREILSDVFKVLQPTFEKDINGDGDVLKLKVVIAKILLQEFHTIEEKNDLKFTQSMLKRKSLLSIKPIALNVKARVLNNSRKNFAQKMSSVAIFAKTRRWQIPLRKKAKA